MEHERHIRLTPEDVREFVSSAEKCDFDIDIFYNRCIFDAKSILCVFSLDLTKTLTVQYAEIDHEFEATLNKFCVA